MVEKLVGKKILAAEDDPAISDLLSIIFLSEGACINIVDSAEEAISKVESDEPDLVIADSELSGEKTGSQMAEELRASGLPVIICTADDLW